MNTLRRAAIAASAALAIAAAGLGWQVYTGGELRRQFEHDVAAGRAVMPSARLVREDELAHLPAPVRRYVAYTGAVGRAFPYEYRARFRGRIRGGPDAPWMPIEVEQVSFTNPPARLFFLRATMMGLPVIGLHRYVGAHATMDIRIAGVFPVMRARGPEMDVSETVTLLNDMAILAPGTLLDPAITWEAVSSDTTAATFTNAGHTVRARIVFDRSGRLTDFVSDDRLAASPDGRRFARWRWSTPMRDYRHFGGPVLPSRGTARWHPPEGAYDYAELEVLDVKWSPADAPH
ncbi:MAG: hypothetical protein HZA61_06930 [Candidatus Eisenbacteria bacterium]|uniref:Uncharacterized protein n=1 Tax=Eiseniibacteriota bacterium TaxID=2212470 RepID=A0A933SDC7_UNCEI|nr:hypothetical protein [Candidatus Eisenbacteria bacterium]